MSYLSCLLKMGGLCFCLVIGSCANPSTVKEDANERLSFDKGINDTLADKQSEYVPHHIALSSRLALPPITSGITQGETHPLYSFVAKNLPIDQALKLFSRTYKLNIVTEKDVQGTVDAEFQNLSFDEAMSALLDSLGFYWERQGQLVFVRAWQSKVFTVDYIRVVRSGAGTSQAQVTSGAESGGESSAAGGVEIKQSDSVEFWRELEAQLKPLVSEHGRLSINRLAGTVQVTDLYPRVREIGGFIRQINNAIHRQVEIEVRIVEVSLSDDFSLGIDWSQIANSAQNNTSFDIGISNIIGSAAGGFTIKSPSLNVGLNGVSDSGNTTYSAMLTALQEQGTVNVISKPHIRTLNNQAAMIKVGTDRTFFRKEVQTDNTTSGSSTSSTDVPQVVTEGLVLALTPQISAEGWIMMDVSPVITRVSSISEVKDSNGNVLSSAPNLEIRQSSALVRAKNGETIIIGGLIQSVESETNRSVPLLGDIPILGYAFKGTYKKKFNRELVIMLTPRLVDGDTKLTKTAMSKL